MSPSIGVPNGASPGVAVAMNGAHPAYLLPRRSRAAAPSLAPDLAARAEREALGAYLGPLTPPRAAALRTVVLGAAVTVAAGALLTRLSGRPWWALLGLGLLLLTGVILLAVGLVELHPGPGRVHLFEGGLLHEHPDGSLEVVGARVNPQPLPRTPDEVDRPSPGPVHPLRHSA